AGRGRELLGRGAPADVRQDLPRRGGARDRRPDRRGGRRGLVRVPRGPHAGGEAGPGGGRGARPVAARRRADGAVPHPDDVPPDRAELARGTVHRQREAGLLDARRGRHAAGPGRPGRAGCRRERVMYGALWRVLPGPAWGRVLILLVLAAAVVLACFEWLFPLVSEYMPFNDPNIQTDAAPAHNQATAPQDPTPSRFL